MLQIQSGGFFLTSIILWFYWLAIHYLEAPMIRSFQVPNLDIKKL